MCGAIQKPKWKTLVSDMKECGRSKDLRKGKLLHMIAIESGCHRNTYVAHTLISMYSKCGSMQDAQAVFENMNEHNVVSWTTLILGYVENGEGLMALDLFASMVCAPNSFTFVAALKACAGLATNNKMEGLHTGMAVHRRAKAYGLDKHVFVGSVLVEMYSKCGSMRDARYAFESMSQHDVVCWGALILGYVENGESLAALELLSSMDCAPCSFVFVAGLKACTCLMDMSTGMFVHGQARQLGFDRHVFVASALVDMYSKFGSMRDARYAFDNMRDRNVVSWNSLILGYVENGESSVAMEMFGCMDCAPTRVTFVAAIKACGSLGALEAGRRIHRAVHEVGLEQDEMVATCLVDFYGKCGDMDAAQDVFKRMHSRNVVSWNALIGGYSLVGDTRRVFSTVKRMQEVGIEVNEVTLLLILRACNHAGEVEEGERYFEYIKKRVVKPIVEHYTCMVDMLGRANRLREALLLVRSMPFEADSVVWTTLLGACRKWSNVEVGYVAFRELVKDEDEVASACLLMGSIYRRLGMHEEEEQIETYNINMKRHADVREMVEMPLSMSMDMADAAYMFVEGFWDDIETGDGDFQKEGLSVPPWDDQQFGILPNTELFPPLPEEKIVKKGKRANASRQRKTASRKAAPRRTHRKNASTKVTPELRRKLAEIKATLPKTAECPKCKCASRTRFYDFNNYIPTQPRYICRPCNKRWTYGKPPRSRTPSKK